MIRLSLAAQPDMKDTKDPNIELVRGWLNEHDVVLSSARVELAWRQDYMRMMGQSIPLPRLTAWHGTHSYRYSGITNTPQPWTPFLDDLRVRLEKYTGAIFNSALANWYRTGNDSVAWHADDEPELGPVIASVSLGAERRFSLKRRDGQGSRLDLLLGSGDLLIMREPMQKHWLHQVPKTKNAVGERINLTFRQVK